MADPLAGRVVLVTGAARGIGAETARRLARRGARLALVGREPERLAALADGLGAGHVWQEADVTDQGALEGAVAAVVAALGGLDVVVANAGIASHATVAVGPVEALVRVLDVNLGGVVRTVAATLPHVTARRGYYLLIASAAAFTALPGLSTYAASKAGVEHFARVLRLELAHRGVSVGVAYPSWVDTDLVRDPRRELASFEATLRALPGPFGRVTSLEACADAFVAGIAERRRAVYVPGSLRRYALLRQLLTSPLVEWVAMRQARRRLPAAERELQALGQAFGAHSAERTDGADRADRVPAGPARPAPRD